MSTESPQPVRIAVVDRLDRADRIVRALHEAGFARERISVVCPEDHAERLDAPAQVHAPSGSHTPSAVLGGSAIGALLGGLTAGVGLAASGGAALLIVGPLLGAAGAGAVAGGFLGAMSARGFEPEVADFYDQALSDGRILVAVDTAAGEGVPAAEVAERVFERAGVEALALPRS